jgi:hypothetical protein
MSVVTRAVMTIGLSLAIVCWAMAQELRSFHGRVVIVAGTTMGFAPDIGSSSSEVDLTKVDQSQYKLLKSGDAVTVVGVVTPEGNRLIAVSITRDW